MHNIDGFCVATWGRTIAEMFAEIDEIKKNHANLAVIARECDVLSNQYLDKMEKHWWHNMNPFLWRKLRKVMAKCKINLEDMQKSLDRWDEVIAEIENRMNERYNYD